MTDKEMPVAETSHYELAFHVLPTVAEGEVANVFQKLKDAIIKHGGVVTVEEAPARFDLAYEIIKYLEGRNRKFTSAYFGWVRFSLEPSNLTEVTEMVQSTKELLRHLIIKLDKTEEAHPFFFHEAIASLKQTQNIDLDEDEELEGDETVEVDEVILDGEVEAVTVVSEVEEESTDKV